MTVAIAISGKICSGKTTLAEAIKEIDNRFKICPVAYSIKQAVYNAVEGVENDNKDEFRKAYQVIGGLGRKLHGSKFWVNRLMRYAQMNGNKFIIVDDVRLPEEVEVITAMSDENFTIRLNISEAAQQGFHIAKYHTPLSQEKRMDYTETALDNMPSGYWDLELPADLEITTLVNTVVRVLRQHSILR